MALNPAKVGLAVQSGVSIVCATCTRYWEGRERGLPGSRCTSTSGCGSPLAGDDFHDYSGPITDFTRWCFMCGNESVYAVQSPPSPRLFGVCDEHAKMLMELRPVNMAQPQAQRTEQMLVKTALGETVRPFRLLKPRKKTLRQVMAETEAEWGAAAKARGEAG